MKQHSRAKKEKPIEPLWFSRYDVRDLLGISLDAVDEEIKAGRLKSFKYGRSRKIHSRDLYAFSWKMRNVSVEHDFDNEFGVST